MDLSWKTLLGAASPLLGSLLGGPFGAAIGVAVGRILGVADPADEQAMVQALAAATPEQKAAILKLDQDYRLEMERLRQAEMKMQIDAAAASDANQTQLSLADAQSGDRYRAYPRPTALWVAVLGMAVQYLVLPLTAMVLEIAMPGKVHLPKMDSTDLTFMTAGLLGLGGMRTYEKVNRVAK